MGTALEALRSSVDRLAGLVRPLGDGATQSAYPTEWSIADVVSHLGSSAAIFHRRLDAGLSGEELANDFASPIWAEWDAKTPAEKVEDGLTADDQLTTRLEGLGAGDRDRVAVPMGPSSFGWDRFVLARLNEHLVHEWDVAVVLDPGTGLVPDGVEHVIDNIDALARFGGRPLGSSERLTIRTSEPERWFKLTLGPDAVELDATEPTEAMLTLPAEALIRLVYGRLDPAHTPPTAHDAPLLERLRPVFPGF